MSSSTPQKYRNLRKLCGGYFGKVKEEKGFLRVTLRKSSDFISESMMHIPLDAEKGIGAIVGIVRAKKLRLAISSVRFPKSGYSVEQAQKWISSNIADEK